MSARVSVLTTVYNGEKVIANAINCILAQSFNDWEHIVVDDGSGDDSLAIARECAAGDSRVKVISAGRVGRGNALNLGLASADGEYVAILDADDRALSKRLEVQVGFLDANPDVGLLGSAANVVDDVGRIVTESKPPIDSEHLRKELCSRYPFVHSSVMYRTSALRSVGGFSDKLSSCLDYDVAVKISEKFQLHSMPDVLIERLENQRSFFASLPAWRVIREQNSIRMRAGRQYGRPMLMQLVPMLRDSAYLLRKRING